MIAVDTNVLVHAHQREAAYHQRAGAVLRDCAQSIVPWAICYHSLVEFYGVVTQPKIWRQPSTPAQAIDQIEAWEESPALRILHDDGPSLQILLRLLKEGKIQGSRVHDGRIAACCLLHGVNELWTIDRDFGRFPELKTRNPCMAGRRT